MKVRPRRGERISNQDQIKTNVITAEHDLKRQPLRGETNLDRILNPFMPATNAIPDSSITIWSHHDSKIDEVGVKDNQCVKNASAEI
jgi:hypothetical protein